jgi:hypothetical protein
MPSGTTAGGHEISYNYKNISYDENVLLQMRNFFPLFQIKPEASLFLHSFRFIFILFLLHFHSIHFISSLLFPAIPRTFPC